ncbi:hypothetical protein Hanom_Chr04g00382951 [Helianthus anomalus]
MISIENRLKKEERICMFNNYNFKLVAIEFATRFLFQENLLKSQSGYQIKLARWHNLMGYFTVYDPLRIKRIYIIF